MKTVPPPKHVARDLDLPGVGDQLAGLRDIDRDQRERPPMAGENVSGLVAGGCVPPTSSISMKWVPLPVPMTLPLDDMRVVSR